MNNKFEDFEDQFELFHKISIDDFVDLRSQVQNDVSMSFDVSGMTYSDEIMGGGTKIDQMELIEDFKIQPITIPIEDFQSNNLKSIYETQYVELSESKIRSLNGQEKSQQQKNSQIQQQQEMEVPYFLNMRNPINKNKRALSRLRNNLEEKEYEKVRGNVKSLRRKKLRILTIGPRNSGKSSFIETFTHYKFSFRKKFSKEGFEITQARKLIKSTEFILEFLDYKGYTHRTSDWSDSIRKEIIRRFKITERNKKNRKMKNFGFWDQGLEDENVGQLDSFSHVFRGRNENILEGIQESQGAGQIGQYHSYYLFCKLIRETIMIKGKFLKQNKKYFKSLYRRM